MLRLAYPDALVAAATKSRSSSGGKCGMVSSEKKMRKHTRHRASDSAYLERVEAHMTRECFRRAENRTDKAYVR
jgi:hypothetical protein